MKRLERYDLIKDVERKLDLINVSKKILNLNIVVKGFLFHREKVDNYDLNLLNLFNLINFIDCDCLFNVTMLGKYNGENRNDFEKKNLTNKNEYYIYLSQLESNNIIDNILYLKDMNYDLLNDFLLKINNSLNKDICDSSNELVLIPSDLKNDSDLCNDFSFIGKKIKVQERIDLLDEIGLISSGKSLLKNRSYKVLDDFYLNGVNYLKVKNGLLKKDLSIMEVFE